MKFDKVVKETKKEVELTVPKGKKKASSIESSTKAKKNTKKGNTGLTDKSGTGAV